MKSIRSLQEYQQLQKIVQSAHESLMGGLRQDGVHYELHWILRSYGLQAQGKAQAVKMGQQLLCDFEQEIR